MASAKPYLILADYHLPQSLLLTYDTLSEIATDTHFPLGACGSTPRAADAFATAVTLVTHGKTGLEYDLPDEVQLELRRRFDVPGRAEIIADRITNSRRKVALPTRHLLGILKLPSASLTSAQQRQETPLARLVLQSDDTIQVDYLSDARAFPRAGTHTIVQSILDQYEELRAGAYNTARLRTLIQHYLHTLNAVFPSQRQTLYLLPVPQADDKYHTFIEQLTVLKAFVDRLQAPTVETPPAALRYYPATIDPQDPLSTQAYYSLVMDVSAELLTHLDQLASEIAGVDHFKTEGRRQKAVDRLHGEFHQALVRIQAYQEAFADNLDRVLTRAGIVNLALNGLASVTQATPLPPMPEGEFAFA